MGLAIGRGGWRTCQCGVKTQGYGDARQHDLERHPNGANLRKLLQDAEWYAEELHEWQDKLVVLEYWKNYPELPSPVVDAFEAYLDVHLISDIQLNYATLQDEYKYEVERKMCLLQEIEGQIAILENLIAADPLS